MKTIAEQFKAKYDGANDSNDDVAFHRVMDEIRAATVQMGYNSDHVIHFFADGSLWDEETGAVAHDGRKISPKRLQ